MRWRSSLLVLAGACDSTFGLHDIQKLDAGYYDAHIDAPFACPGSGTLPVFQRDFRQALFQDCTSYTVSLRTGRAMALCRALDFHQFVAEGPLDGDRLSPVPSISSSPGVQFVDPHLGADGMLATVRELNGATTATVVYRHDATGWKEATMLLPGSRITLVSEPSLGPGSHILVVVDATTVHELVDDGTGTWKDVAQYTFAELGTTPIATIHLGADALRMWFSVGTTANDVTIQYADRASTTDRFTPRGALPDVGFVGEGFITEDCGRVYFSTLSSVWFAQAP